MSKALLLRFLSLESFGGILLFFAAIVAVVFENSFLGPSYDAIRDLPIAVSLGSFEIAKPLLLWVNDGLMAIFFLLVGLELKREALDGQLSSRDQIVLPLAAAIGGIAIPSGIYAFMNLDNPETIRGWAIPAATDIAFALGILSLFGKRVPLALKVFLTALAIFDDIAAIAIIAVFYTANLSLISLALAGVVLLALIVLNRLRVTQLTPYFLLGVILWVAVLKSGVHATLAGVALALAIPFHDEKENRSPLKYVEHVLHPWVAYGVLPVFAFLNAGVSLQGVSLETLLHPITFGIAAGLFAGKQIGAFGAAWLAVRLGFAKLPGSLSWASLYGAALLSGVGFTMSLFIGTLAFTSLEDLKLVRLGVIFGSLASGIMAIVVLSRVLPKAEDVTEEL